MSSRRKKNTNSRRSGRYAFSGGKIICGECGAHYHGNSGYYRCSARMFKGKAHCSNQSIKAKNLQAGIVGVIQDLYDDAELDRLAEKMVKQVEHRKSQVPKLKAQITSAKRKLIRWEAAYEAGKIDLAYFSEKAVPLKNEIESIENKLKLEKAHII